MNHKKFYLIFLVSLFFCIVIHAQDEIPNLIPSRPGLSPFPSRVDKGVLIFEAGFSNTRETADSEKDRNTKLPLQLRYGLWENMELNIALTYRSLSQNTSPVDTSFSGLDATTIGAKFRVAEERGIYPRIEFHGRLKLPYFGEEAFIPGDVEPAFDMNFLHNVSKSFRFTYGFGMFWRGPDENGIYGLKATKFINSSNAFYAEHYAYLRGNGNNEAHVGAGYILLVNRKIQLDVGLDVGGMKGRTFIGGTIGASVLLKENN